MRMKKLVASMLSAGLIMSLGTGSMMVSAEGKNSTQSEVKVQFSVDETEEAKLYDPKDPSKEIDEDRYGELDNITGQKGPLALNYVTNLNFGGEKIDVTKSNYELIAEDLHAFQVTDRRGTGAGWNVTAQLDTFKDSEGDDAETLPGSTITFSNGSATTPNASLKDQEPEVKNAMLTAGGDAKPMAVAGEEEGRGAWLVRWIKGQSDAEVKLEVAADAASPGKHVTTINWTLENGPYQKKEAATDAKD